MRLFKEPASILLMGAVFGLIGLSALALACGGDFGGGDESNASGAAEGDDDYFDDDSGDASDDDASGDDDASDDDDTPPEPEEDVDPGTRPRICDNSVYVLNSDGDFVSRIHVDSLQVTTIEVGKTPILLRATDDCSRLVTLNEGDDSVSLINVSDNGVSNLDIRPGLNALEISPNGHYGLAFYKFEGSGGSGTQGYGEISIIDMDEDEVLSLAVGFPPDEVLFTTSDRAILVSETTIALVGLDTGDFSTLPTGLDIDEGQKLKKVSTTADGKYALILAEASTSLLALDLSDQSISEIELGCYPTDLDVAETGDRSLLLCREDGKIIVLDNDTMGLEEYETDEVVGSGEITSDGSLALLFTNSEPIERVHLFNPADGTLETRLTVKPLIGAAIAPGDQAAVLLHFGGDNAPVDDFDEWFDSREAFSVMDFDDGRINPVEVPETPLVVSFGDDGHYALIPLPDHRNVVLADLISGLADVVTTPSTPLDVGVISDLGLAFVLQDHPLGRISFVDVDTLAVRTITGFLLNGEIE